jgi:ParB/RepB/Spo0J family partition protein
LSTQVFTGNGSLRAAEPQDAIYSRLPVESVVAWEENPRKHFDEASLSELAANIAEVGLQQPIVVRRVAAADGSPQYQIVIGERRWRACRLAGLKVIPCLIRTGIDDATALRLAMAENVRRRDLSAIEEARGYSRLMEMGLTQAAIAKDFGVDASTVSNLRRLLKLPQSVQEMVSDGRLSATAARALLRFEGFDAVIEVIAREAIARDASVRVLEKDVPFTDQLVRENLIVEFHSALFNHWEACVKCPFNAYRKDPWGRMVCLKPEHFEELQQEAKAEERRRVAELQKNTPAVSAQIEEIVKRAALDTTSGVGAAYVAGQATAAKMAAEAGEPVTETVDAPVLDVSKLPYESFTYISTRTLPAGCSEACECRKWALDRTGRAVVVCLNPKRLESLTRSKSLQEGKERRDRFNGYREQIKTLLEGSTTLDQTCARAAMLLCGDIQKVSNEILSTVLTEEAYPAQRKLFVEQKHTWEIKDAERWECLSKLGLTEMISLATRIAVLQELRQQQEYKGDKVPITSWVLALPATETAKEAMDETREPGGHDGFEGTEYCLRCNQEIALDVLGGQLVVHEGPARMRRYDTSLLVIEDEMGDHGLYCPACAPSVAFCRVCGCTEEMPCEAEDGGYCHWAFPDLCSVCAGKPIVTVTADATAAALGELVTATVAAIAEGKLPEPVLCASCGVQTALEGGKYCGLCDPGIVQTCSECRGGGWIRMEARAEGEGYLRSACTSCGGTGYMRRDALESVPA